MTKDEIRMPKKIPNPNLEREAPAPTASFGHLGFVILSAFVIRVSSLSRAQSSIHELVAKS